jgi:hypothetical protein
MIRRLIAAGGKPWEDPELSAQYYMLIDEYGLQLFQFEDESGEPMYICPENESDVSFT